MSVVHLAQIFVGQQGFSARRRGRGDDLALLHQIRSFLGVKSLAWGTVKDALGAFDDEDLDGIVRAGCIC